MFAGLLRLTKVVNPCQTAKVHLFNRVLLTGSQRSPVQHFHLSAATSSAPQNLPMAKRKVWIDCDAGLDDAQGLMVALRSDLCEILGISICFGNVAAPQVARNVARILKLCDREVPLYMGAEGQLMGDPMEPTDYHGTDGLGDAPDADPPASSIQVHLQPGAACIKLAEAAAAHAGNLTVIATAPMTNIALACLIDPAFPENVSTLQAMGGAEGKGNVTPCAEWNFHCDPEAAHVVMRKFAKIHLLTWEASLRNTLPWSVLKQWSQKDTKQARFLAATMCSLMTEAEAGKSKDSEDWVICDPLSFIAALDPQSVLSTRNCSCSIELHQADHRGQSKFDFEKPGNIDILHSFDMSKVETLLEEALC